jgi:hypothetical protein
LGASASQGNLQLPRCVVELCRRGAASHQTHSNDYRDALHTSTSLVSGFQAITRPAACIVAACVSQRSAPPHTPKECDLHADVKIAGRLLTSARVPPGFSFIHAQGA